MNFSYRGIINGLLVLARMDYSLKNICFVKLILLLCLLPSVLASEVIYSGNVTALSLDKGARQLLERGAMGYTREDIQHIKESPILNNSTQEAISDKVWKAFISNWVDSQKQERRSEYLTLVKHYENKKEGRERNHCTRKERYFRIAQQRLKTYFVSIACFQRIWGHHTIYGKDQLRQRIAWALSQILVVSDKGGNIKAEGGARYYDILSSHAFGSYKSLLKEVSISAAMGRYLSIKGSRKSNHKKGTHPDENYARELMQLFTIGLVRLNQNGTVKLENGKQQISYTQNDVEELAKVFTGWHIVRRQRAKNGKLKKVTHLEEHGNYQGNLSKSMVFYPEWHSKGKINFLGEEIKLSKNGEKDIEEAIDILIKHPNTAPFLAKKLIKLLVTSNPSPKYVKAVADQFGKDGDLSAMIKEILSHKEALHSLAWSDKIIGEVHPFGRLKEPTLRLSQLHHYFKAYMDYDLDGRPDKPTNNAHQLVRFLGAKEQRPLAAPSVFNFYQPDYKPEELLGNNVAPAFQVAGSSQLNGLHNTIYQLLIAKGSKKKKVHLRIGEQNYTDFLDKDNMGRFNLKIFSDRMVENILGFNDKGNLLSSYLEKYLKKSLKRVKKKCRKSGSNHLVCEEKALIREALVFLYLSPDMAIQQ